MIDARARPVPGLYCLGALARGESWEMTAIAELRAAVHALAKRLRAPAAARTLAAAPPLPARAARAD